MSVITVLRNLTFNEGDVILHFGYSVEIAYPIEDEEIIKRFRNAVSAIQAQGKQARIAMFDTVLTFPGARFPWEALVEVCRELGVLSFIDGAHGVGHIDLAHLGSVGPDFMVSNCYKWLMVPRGCAILYVPFRNQALIATSMPTSWGYETNEERAKLNPQEYFSRLFNKVSTTDNTPYCCVPLALKFRALVCSGEANIRKYYDGSKVAKWMQERTSAEYETYLPIKFYAGEFWCRVSGQIYLTMDDFEWAAKTLQQLCERAIAAQLFGGSERPTFVLPVVSIPIPRISDCNGRRAPSDLASRIASKAQAKASATATNKSKSTRPKHTPKAKDAEAVTTEGTSPEIIQQVFSSLQGLEQSYRTISRRLKQFEQQPNEGSAPGANTADASQPVTTDGNKSMNQSVHKSAQKLGSKLRVLSGTLEVLRNVLGSQQISIGELSKEARKQNKPTKDANKAKPTNAAETRTDADVSRASDSLSVKSFIKKIPTGAAAVAATVAATVPTPTPEAPSTPSPPLRKDLGPLDSLPAHDKYFPRVPAVEPSTESQSPEAKTARKPKKPNVITKKSPPNVKVAKASKLELTPVDRPGGPEVPKLAYGLDRVLFNPGVYHLQDPRSRVYNFDPYLSKIMPTTEFDFGALKKYVTSSKDTTLNDLAAKLGKKYSGSTSSMTSMLSHFHFLLSAWRPINPENLSQGFEPDFSSYTLISRAPAAIFLTLKNGVYSIDADKEYDTANVLSMLGKSMEKLLTLPKEEFERYRHKYSDSITEEERNAEEAFHFSTLGDFLMRSQLDAYDKRLPGTGMFDLKTRAVVSIRMDAAQFKKGQGYEIRRRFGQWESFEREYYDMIRAAFLKYSLQVRMGRMDGIFVAFHNTQRIFGFQYIPLEEMDTALHGTDDRSLGDQEFKLSLHLLNEVLDRATRKFPGRTLRLHVETRPGDPPFTYIFARPVTDEEVAQVQNSNQAAVAEFERKLMGIEQEENEAEASELDIEPQPAQEEEMADTPEETRQQTLEFWEEMQDKVEEAVENDALGVNHVREAIQSALEQSGLLKARSAEEAQSYVESLLDALTGSQASDASKAAEDEYPAVSSELASPDTVNEVSAGEDSVTEGGQARLEFTEEPQSSVEEADSASSALESSTRSSDLSLKELILRVAERIDNRPETEETTLTPEQAASEISKLGEFERLLVKLVETKHEKSSSETTEDVAPALSPESNETPAEAANEASAADKTAPAAEEQPKEEPLEDIVGDEILGMHLTVRNKVDNKYVTRPERPKDRSSRPLRWTLEYSIEEIPAQSAKRIYQSIQTRRKKALKSDSDDRSNQWRQMWQGKLQDMSQRGRRFRQKEDAHGRKNPVHLFEREEPLTWQEAFGHEDNWLENQKKSDGKKEDD
ncbi:mRNA degradation protein like [Verticillium longisporum]|nr:mRNA degradation protein like [Verticillium longisporum]